MENQVRDLRHEQIFVKIYYKYNGFDICQEDVLFFLDEVEPDVWEAETKEDLPFEPSCIGSDVQAAMIENKIHGFLIPQIDYNIAKTVAV